MTQKIDLDMTVYELVQAVPEIVPIMVDMGLDGVTNPAMLKTAGRFMTLRKGAQMKKIPLDKLTASIEAAGFEVEKHE
ncbi:DUF1858 domain-containing protein [Lapidilactobacillus mulanensis]|uniref:DUF1858 domain-containing protein n=1 Tax=Lapidilactobacillus mulanensis TaxID=2485999 RepID=A0ABW4DP46_9LACO|nr:DUF1858 domain-containing protein [Lapidilactobacillus mulanensis]